MQIFICLSIALVKPGSVESLHAQQAHELDMDHVVINFFRFRWALTFIGPLSYCIARLSLEHTHEMVENDKHGGFLPVTLKVFLCRFPVHRPYYHSKYKVANLLAVDTKTFVKDKMDDARLPASEIIFLLWFITIAAAQDLNL